MSSRLIRLLVALYPRPWRERYDAEFTALLEDHPLSALDVLDVMLGAVDARANAYLGPYTGPIGADAVEALIRVRAGTLTMFVGYVGFVLSGLAFYGMVDDSPFVPLMRVNLPLRLTWLSVEAGAALALLTIVGGGIPIALTVLRQAAAGRRDLRLLVAAPFAAAVALAMGAVIVTLIANGSLPGPGSLPAHRVAVVSGVSGLFVVAAALSTLAASVAVLRADLAPRPVPERGGPATSHPFTLAAPASLVGTACLVVMLASTVLWGLLARVGLPGAFNGGYPDSGVTPLHAWLAIVGAMAVAATVAIAGTFQTVGARPRRAARR